MRIDCLITCAKNHHQKTGAFIVIWVHTQDLPPIQPKIFLKKPRPNPLSQRQWPQESKSSSTAPRLRTRPSAPLGARPPPAIDQPHTTEDSGSSSPKGAAANIQASPSQYEEQLLQIFADMKEHMKEQQAQSDRDREHMALDRENAIREQEAVRQLNKQLQTKIAALQNTQWYNTGG